MRKWKLLLSTLPIVVVVAAIKVLLRFWFDFDGLIEFGDVGVVLTGAVFLMGFMLSGVMSDYKESEKLPGELACTLENLEETLVAGTHAKGGDVDVVRRQVLGLYDTIQSWLTKKTEDAALYAAITAFAPTLATLDAGPAGRAQSELWSLRRSLTRMDVIHKTTFLQTGYALLDTLVVLSIAVVMLARFKSPIGEAILVPVVTLVYVYMLRLIRDADDPFDYDEGGSHGAAEVDLFPLTDYAARLRARLGL
jgi:hypothetical protein